MSELGSGSAIPSGVEIERKFKVERPPPDLATYPSGQIEQGYLAITETGLEVRIRSYDGRSFLTIKSGGDEIRVEEEIEIDARRFRSLWPLTEGRRIRKRRYLLPAQDAARIELDVYEGGLAGLVIAEVEFESAAAAAVFVGPAWLGLEVTNDPAYKNQRLALDGLPET
jgi:CYTH domain-containing protein